MHISKRVIIYGLLFVGIVGAVLSYRSLRRLSYPVVALAMITIYVIATYHTPMPRYLAVVVPLHLTLGWLAADHPKIGIGLLVCSGTLMMALTALTVNGYVFY